MAKSLKTQETRNQEYVVEDINNERQRISWRVNEFDRGLFAFAVRVNMRGQQRDAQRTSRQQDKEKELGKKK